MAEKIVVLDACALIATLRGEPGGDRVIDLLSSSGTQGFMHAVNVCEVYYDAVRRDKGTVLEDVVDALSVLGITIVTEFGLPLVRRAGQLKADRRKLSLADCIALATAADAGGVLLTTDHHEMDPLARDGLPIQFIR